MNDDDYSGPITNLSQNGQKKTPSGWHAYWGSELAAANKRTKKWRKQGNRIEARFQDRRGLSSNSYEGDDQGSMRVNLFHANTKTLRDMLYANLPKIDVSRANQDADDDEARVASSMLQRILTKLVEASGDDTKSVLGYCLENRLLPGLGIARVRYEYDTETEAVPEIKGWDVDGNEVTLAEGYEDELITAERAPIDYVHWDDFRWGWARTWSEVPWISFRTFVRKDDAVERFGEELAEQLSYSNKSIGNVSEKRLTSDEVADAWDRAEVWEIWDKDRRKNFWWSKDPAKILDTKEDILELEGFWPCPEPMLANCTTSMLLPQPDFVIAKDLYNEIDDLESRISVITSAVRVVGVYDEAAEGITRMLQEGIENDLIPVKNYAKFKEGGGSEAAIDWMPIKEIAETLNQLVQQRSDAMALLYEVTGMAEIMRGGNGPDRETAEAASGKRQFASVRVQGLQEDFARFSSDLMRLRAEVISKHFSEETILHDSNIAKSMDADKGQVGVQLIKEWENTTWRVTIQPESMAMIDYSSRQRDRTAFLGAISTFMSNAMPVAESEPKAVPFLLQILKWTMSGFRGSKEIEGVLDKAIDQMLSQGDQQGEKPPSDEQIKAQAAESKQKHEEKMEQMKSDNQLRVIQAKASADVAELHEELKMELRRIHAEMIAAITGEKAQSEAAIQQDDHETANELRVIGKKSEKNVAAS